MFKSVIKLLQLTPVASTTCRKPICNDDIVGSMIVKRLLHLTSTNDAERRDLRTFRKFMPVKDDGLVGEKGKEIDGLTQKDNLFPDVNTPNRLFDGILYKELPIINIKATKNNTIMSLTDFKGLVHIIRSCGIEGFKTARKGTNIAAQTTAVTMSSKVLALGVRTVRVRIQGIGPGRMSSIKGLQLGGLTIVSITDNTHVSWNPPRPRKQRRV